MPRLRSIGFMPAATDLAPSRTIAWARTVAVVVPSPAASEVLEATSRTIWAPMFSNLSASSISLATVTPSLVMRGAPKLLSSTTLRPLGPSADLGAGPLPEQDPVAFLDVKRIDLTVLVACARPNGDDLALLRLLSCGIGDDDPPFCLLICLDAASGAP